jgi:hypothetical protein
MSIEFVGQNCFDFWSKREKETEKEKRKKGLSMQNVILSN